MDAATFADLPIVAGVGRGPAIVGATFDELQAALGPPSFTPRHAGDNYYPEWRELGMQAWMDGRTNRAIALSFVFTDPDHPKFSNVAGRTDRGIAFGDDGDAIV